MIRYFNAQRQAKPAGATPTVRQLDCGDDRQLWNDSANGANLVWDGMSVRFKTEAEKVAEMIPGKKMELSMAVQAYIYSKYDSGEQASMLALDSHGNNTQKAVLTDIWTWIFDTVQKADYFVRVQTLLVATTFAELDAISMDFSNNDVSKPPYSYSDIVVLT